MVDCEQMELDRDAGWECVVMYRARDNLVDCETDSAWCDWYRQWYELVEPRVELLTMCCESEAGGSIGQVDDAVEAGQSVWSVLGKMMRLDVVDHSILGHSP